MLVPRCPFHGGFTAYVYKVILLAPRWLAIGIQSIDIDSVVRLVHCVSVAPRAHAHSHFFNAACVVPRPIPTLFNFSTQTF